MKLVILLILEIAAVRCREVYFEDLMYFPKESNSVIEYGTLKLTRSKDKTLIFLRGNFSVSQDLGNTKNMMLELYNQNALMVKSVKPFCEFIKGETMFWPSMVKSSNMPQNNPCPFPSVSALARFYELFHL